MVITFLLLQIWEWLVRETVILYQLPLLLGHCQKEKMTMKKTAIVTGGSRGIGYAIARQLGLDGYQVCILATGPQEKYEAALQALTQEGIVWHYVQGSVDRTEDRKRLVEETVARFGRIDILVNNAGVAPLERRDLLEMTEESFDRVIGINTKGTLFLTQLVANQMLKQEVIGPKRGTIVNVGSCSAEVSSVSRGEYCISKAGVSMITQLFADRLANEGIVFNNYYHTYPNNTIDGEYKTYPDQQDRKTA